MNCSGFGQCLDELGPGDLPAPAAAHARDCAACARALEHARALDSALARHLATLATPREQARLTGFADRVLARVERVEARGVRWLAVPDPLPWWVRAAAEPGVALASALAALLLWRGPEFMAAVRAWAPAPAPDGSRLAAWATSLRLDAALDAVRWVFAPVAGADWAVALGVTLGVAPLLGLLGWALWRAGERIAAGGRLVPSR